MDLDQITGRLRPAVLAAGPLAVLSFVMLIAAVATAGSGMVAVEKSPIAVASSVAGLAAIVLTALAVAYLALTLPALRHGIGWVGVLVLATGVLLGAGGQWSMVFVVPALAEAAPELLATGLGPVLAGFVVSFLTLAVGGILTGVALIRSKAVPRWSAVPVLVGGLVCVAPLPARFFVLACGLSAVAAVTSRRQAAPAVVPAPA